MSKYRETEGMNCGVTEGALVSLTDVMNLRTIPKAELKGSKDGEYYLGVDVARSNDESNNQCSVAVVKVKRNADSRITRLQVVNIVNIPAVLNFKVQAQEVMKIRNLYNAKAVVVDSNGLGAGLIDQLVLEQFDERGESLGCWATINTEDESELSSAEEILYSLKAQQNNNEVIVNFIDTIESEKLQLLEKRADTSIEIQNEDYLESVELPSFQTDMLLDEIANLKLRVLASGKLTVDQQTSTVDKDRYSALAYVLWYINEYEDIFEKHEADDIDDFILIN